MLKLNRHKLSFIAVAAIAAISLLQAPLTAMAQSNSADKHFTYPSADTPVQASVNVNRANLDFHFNLQADFAIVRVSGPDFFTISKRVENADHISVDLLKDLELSGYVDNEIDRQALSDFEYLPDGRYTFEIMVHSAEGVRHTTKGSFEVYAGNAFLLPARTAIPSSDGEVSKIQKPGLLQRLAGSVLDFVVPSAHAQGVVADDFVSIIDVAGDDNARLNFGQTTSGTQEYSLQVFQGDFKILPGFGSPALNNVPFLNIVGSTGKVGFGTDAPQETIHLVAGGNNFAGFRIEDTRGHWTLSTGGLFEDLGFRIRDSANGTTPFRIDTSAPTNSIRVAADGNVGLGTAAPAVNLDIVDTARAAVAINAGADQQADFTLNTGGVDRWVFRARAVSNNFEIARRDSGGGFLDVPLLIPYSDGVTQVRNGMTHIPTTTPPAPGGGATVFVDSSNGDLRVRFANGTIRTIANN